MFVALANNSPLFLPFFVVSLVRFVAGAARVETTVGPSLTGLWFSSLTGLFYQGGKAKKAAKALPRLAEGECYVDENMSHEIVRVVLCPLIYELDFLGRGGGGRGNVNVQSKHFQVCETRVRC